MEQIDDKDASSSVTRKHIEDIQEFCDSHLLEPYVSLSFDLSLC